MRNTRSAGRSIACLTAVLLALVLGAVVARVDGIPDADRTPRSGKLEEAKGSYQTAAGDGVARSEAGVGRVWLGRGQLDEGMNAFRRAQALDPRLALVSDGQGEVLCRGDNCSAAVPTLEQATRLHRGFPEARLAMAERLVNAGKIDAALAELDQGLESGSKRAPRFLVSRGMASAPRDSLRLAGLDLTRAREPARNDASIRRAIGELYATRGTWALAIPTGTRTRTCGSTPTCMPRSRTRSAEQGSRACRLRTTRSATRTPGYRRRSRGDRVWRQELSGWNEPRSLLVASVEAVKGILAPERSPRSPALIALAWIGVGVTATHSRADSLVFGSTRGSTPSSSLEARPRAPPSRRS